MARELRPQAGTKVLIVEDEGITAKGMKRRLETLGYTVIGIAESGASALALARGTRADVVLMDIVLQGEMDGVQTARELQRDQDIPIVFLTAYSDAATVQRAKETIPYGYLVKPFEPLELHTTIEMALYRHQAERQVREQTASLRALTTRLQTVREEERTRIAREIHDVLAQELTLMKFDLTWLAKRVGLPADENTRRSLQEKADTMMARLDLTVEAVQKVATELRPAVLDSLGLPAAVEWQAEEFQKRTGIGCQPRVVKTLPALDLEKATGLFRILQESLTNVARHARATLVEILLESRDGILTLRVSDNGRGISESQVADPRSIGLVGMRERGLLLGGGVQIRGHLGRGTSVTVRVPVSTPSGK